MDIKVKNYTSSIIYNSGKYESIIVNYLMTSERIDKSNKSFEDIRYDVKKRQIMSSLVKLLDSNNVVLLLNDNPLPKAFKVFAAKDIKYDGKLKVFIDADVITKSEGSYVCKNPDILIAYLINAMTTLIYYSDPNKLILKDTIIKEGTHAFSALFTYTIDYLYKININTDVNSKCLYLSANYYLRNIMCKDMTESLNTFCCKYAGINERQAEIINIQLEDNCYENIKTFIQNVGSVLKLPKLTLELFLEKWMYLLKPGTQFALELFPAFSSLLTNAYVGCYLNNQKTIEKIVGKSMMEFSRQIILEGASLL